MDPVDDDTRADRECPHCGGTDAPHLIVRLGTLESSGVSWRCRTCGEEWSDVPAARPVLARPRDVPTLDGPTRGQPTRDEPTDG